jgi:hypothetical protein
MTLTADPRAAKAHRSARPAKDVPAAASPASVGAVTTPRPALVALRVRDDVYRVTDDARIIGYVQIAGPVYVTLLGSIYNTSCEIAQCLDLETAVARLEPHRG